MNLLFCIIATGLVENLMFPIILKKLLKIILIALTIYVLKSTSTILFLEVMI